jgi:hypothetical protein
MSKQSGGCLCRAVRYEISGELPVGASCFCRACQYVSGGAPAHVVRVPRARFALVAGAPRVHWSVAESGTRVAREFCETCGTPLFAHNENFPDYLGVKVGSLDDPAEFRPQLHIWTDEAQPWHTLDAAVARFPRNPSFSARALLELGRVAMVRLGRLLGLSTAALP